jgi:hypothetical protein
MLNISLAPIVIKITKLNREETRIFIFGQKRGGGGGD